MDLSAILPLLMNKKLDKESIFSLINNGGGDFSSVMKAANGDFGSLTSLLNKKSQNKNLHTKFVLSFINDDILGKIIKYFSINK